jgi:hypothetical protein
MGYLTLLLLAGSVAAKVWSDVLYMRADTYLKADLPGYWRNTIGSVLLWVLAVACIAGVVVMAAQV